MMTAREALAELVACADADRGPWSEPGYRWHDAIESARAILAAPAAVAPEAPLIRFRHGDPATGIAAPAEAPQGDQPERADILKSLRSQFNACMFRDDCIARIESLQARLNAPVPKSEWQQMEADLAAARERERALREALQRVDGQLSRVLHEMAGSVSLCWEPKPSGEFHSTQAVEFVASAIAELRALAAPDNAPQHGSDQ